MSLSMGVSLLLSDGARLRSASFSTTPANILSLHVSTWVGPVGRVAKLVISASYYFIIRKLKSREVKSTPKSSSWEKTRSFLGCAKRQNNIHFGRLLELKDCKKDTNTTPRML